MNGGTRGRLTRAVIAALVCGLALPAVSSAAKTAKKKGGGTVDTTTAVNQAIPDRPSGTNTPYGLLTSTITVGKRFKGKQVRDVNVTVQTTGTSGADSAAQDLRARLTAPNGVTATLFGFLAPGNTVGPLTVDDESPLFLANGPPVDPQALFSPWVGTAQPTDVLFAMDGGPVRGNWTLRIADLVNGDANTLVQWRLNVVAGKPFRTK
jgi:subtilisin-like proprotein convertase family protein